MTDPDDGIGAASHRGNGLEPERHRRLDVRDAEHGVLRLLARRAVRRRQRLGERVGRRERGERVLLRSVPGTVKARPPFAQPVVEAADETRDRLSDEEKHRVILRHVGEAELVIVQDDAARARDDPKRGLHRCPARLPDVQEVDRRGQQIASIVRAGHHAPQPFTLWPPGPGFACEPSHGPDYALAVSAQSNSSAQAG